LHSPLASQVFTSSVSTQSASAGSQRLQEAPAALPAHGAYVGCAAGGGCGLLLPVLAPHTPAALQTFNSMVSTQLESLGGHSLHVSPALLPVHATLAASSAESERPAGAGFSASEAQAMSMMDTTEAAITRRMGRLLSKGSSLHSRARRD
jgi:hypothetical protein